MPEINEYGQTVGDALPDWHGASVLQRTVLEGRWCRLEPLVDPIALRRRSTGSVEKRMMTRWYLSPWWISAQNVRWG